MKVKINFVHQEKVENLGSIQEEINTLENIEPDKRTKEYREWAKQINLLIDKYNDNSKFKAYQRV